MTVTELAQKLKVSADRLRDEADCLRQSPDAEEKKLAQTLDSTACLYDWHLARLTELPSWAPYFAAVEL